MKMQSDSSLLGHKPQNPIPPNTFDKLFLVSLKTELISGHSQIMLDSIKKKKRNKLKLDPSEEGKRG